MHRSISASARLLLLVAALVVAGAVARPLHAQGKSRATGKPAKEHASSGKRGRKVSTSQAVLVSREILVKHGFTVVRVEHVGANEVIYYRRGNNGRGRGLGPMERMVVKPSGDAVVFEAAPKSVLLDINIRLGL